jgi:putative glutamine amidotransferase
MRPIVGITSYVEPAGWAVWESVPAVLVPYAYVRMVTAAGGRAVVLPPDGADADVVRVLDALVLAGGADVGPEHYGEPADARTDSRPDRDAGELPLLRAALVADLPILGVCRGMQLMAVAYGGRLHQHLPDVVGHDKHRPAPGRYGSHGVRFAADSRIATILGGHSVGGHSVGGDRLAGETEVNSYHHQGVADPGGLRVTGWADDGVIEVVEDPDRRFALGVQWHPEEARDVRLFEALVLATAAR